MAELCQSRWGGSSIMDVHSTSPKTRALDSKPRALERVDGHGVVVGHSGSALALFNLKNGVPVLLSSGLDVLPGERVVST